MNCPAPANDALDMCSVQGHGPGALTGADIYAPFGPGGNEFPSWPVNAVEKDRGDEEIGNGADGGASLARGLDAV